MKDYEYVSDDEQSDELPDIIDMPDLDEESAAQKNNQTQSAKGIKILTPNQVINRLLIGVVQVHAGKKTHRN